jgi:hypothetical protein
MADEENETSPVCGVRAERSMWTVFTCEYVCWLVGNSNGEGGWVERLAADEVIRNSRSDGPADRTPYGMGDHGLAGGGPQ